MKTVLDYPYAKEHKVLLLQGEAQSILQRTPDTQLTALSEALRLCAVPPTVELLNLTDFELALSNAYQTKSEEVFTELADSAAFEKLLDAVEDSDSEDDLLDNADQPIKQLVNAMLTKAISKQASDVHIDTYENELEVRYRRDSFLQPMFDQTSRSSSMIVSRIKVMAGLDIAEKRMPQDGRMELRINGKTTDIRVSTLPTRHGERVVLRILNNNAASLKLSELGLDPAKESKLMALVHKPNGILLVCGPVGSGKSTTLYASINQLRNGMRNIMTIEDPIEYDLRGISQTQVNDKKGLTFAEAFTSILRQDPNVVMVGEIRDKETASIAAQASVSGHLILSTLHANSGVGVVTRLAELDIQPVLLASSLGGVVSQRLIRKLCPHCKTEIVADAAQKEALRVSEHEDVRCFEPKGCEHCDHTGYNGRLALFEILSVDEGAKKLIRNGASESELADYFDLEHNGLYADGISKVLEGTTSIEEIMRVTGGY